MYFVSDTYEGTPLSNPPITISDANPTATANGACGPILITDPDSQTLEACDRANYRFGADWPRTYPTGGPKYYIQSAHDPNDWDWGEIPSAHLADVTVPAGYIVDLYAMVPIGDGSAGQDCGNVGNIAGTVCDHAMGLDESPNFATGDTDWVDTGFRFVEDDTTSHDGSLGIQREIWIKTGVSGTYTMRHPVTHGWGYMYFVSDTYEGTPLSNLSLIHI